MVAKGEYYFFDKVKDDCTVIFDIGCREDTHYAEMSKYKNIFLFEPNPKSFTKCQEKLQSLTDNVVSIFNFGLGKYTRNIEYYEDAESFMKRTVHFQSQSKPIILKIKQFTEFITENNITFIDFLKIDTEGSEPDILLDGKDFINSSVKYIQFEYASTWLDRVVYYNLQDIIDWFGDNFNFYFLLDEDHPISMLYPGQMTPLTQDLVLVVEQYMRSQYGFNIAMVRK